MTISTVTSQPSKSDLLRICVECLRGVLDQVQADVRVDVPLSAMGVDSRAVLAFVAELSRRLARPIDAALPFAHPTLSALATCLSGEAPERSLLPLQRPDEPVAIIGIGCRFPGGVSDPEQFWQLLVDGRDAVGKRPSSRPFEPSESAPAEKLLQGGFLADVAGFDASFFGISPREAAEMDPQQRLMLELSWEALEDAAILPGSLAGSRAGVFVGCMWRDYAQHSAPVAEVIEQHTATGLDLSIIAARVSYRLGLRGPSLTVNTACSSSLVSVHLACQSLRQRESSVALAGGVNLILSRHSSVAMDRFGGLSPDGRCKAFDARADGYVRGEGGGVVVLKLLREALKDGDPIYCVIRGSAVNNDGASNGLTAPSPIAQAELLRDAYARADVSPSRVHYVEAHGTGTRLGDPIEAEALGRVLGQGRTAEQALRIGSVKTNLGHLEAAAGIAGLIKVALCVQRRFLPKSLHFQQENPDLRLAARGLSVQHEASVFPLSEDLPLAGVSAFGFGGTNAHVVVQGLPRRSEQLLCVAADDAATLHERSQALARAAAELSSSAELSRLCEESALHFGKGALRIARVVGAPQDVRRALTDASPGSASGKSRILFVFSGVGSQWLGMGRGLMSSEPVFRQALEACDRAIAPLAGFSVMDALAADDAREIASCARYEPLIFSIQVALHRLLNSFGVVPDAVVGHSIGEVAAAHCAGILSLEEAARVICVQAKVFARLEGQGAMALLALSSKHTESLIAALSSDAADELTIAAVNGPGSTVVSGPADCVAELIDEARQRSVFAAEVCTSVAFHSRAAGRLTNLIGKALSDLTPAVARIPMISSVDARWLRGPECDFHYWVQNQRAPVQFARALASLSAQGPWVSVELSPHALLGRELRLGLAKKGAVPCVLSTLERGEQASVTLLRSVAALYEAGCDLNFRALTRGSSAARRLPDAARAHLPLGLRRADGQAEAMFSLPLSAHSAEALRAQAERFRTHLTTRADLALEDVVHKAATARTHFGHRLVVHGESRLALGEALAAFVRGDHAAGLVFREPSAGAARPKLKGPVFVFSGHGSQWPGMCTELIAREPVFRAVIEECERLFERHGVVGLRAQLLDLNASQRADEVQPRLFAVQVALAALWRSWGVEPAAVVGHSVGEIAAAHVAGCLDLESAARAVCERARVLAPALGRGGMVLVELSAHDAEHAIAAYRGRLALAVHHSPRFSVLSGEPAALDAIVAELVEREIFCRQVAVDYASHGPQMGELAQNLAQSLSGLGSSAPHIPMMSTSTGAWIDGAACDAAYWARNLRQPVRFAGALGQMMDDGFDSFLELSPHPLLTNAMLEIGLAGARDVSVFASLRRGAAEQSTLRESLATLFVNGHEVDFRDRTLAADRRVPLPTYPFQRVPYWKSVAAVSRAEPVTGLVRKLPAEASPAAPRVAPLKARLHTAGAEQRHALLSALLVAELARVLRTELSQVDRDAPFSNLGLDSLLGLELRNRIEAATGISIPGTLLWSRPSVNGLTEHLVQGLSRTTERSQAS